MDINTILSSTVIVAVMSGFVSYIIARRQGNLQYITGERKEWRDKIREIAHIVDGASYEKTLVILNELKLRINAFGNNAVQISYSSDAHIWELIKDLENKKPSKQELTMKQRQLIEYISLLLKYDWERSKREVKGNIYEIITKTLYLVLSVYLIVCIYLSRDVINVENYGWIDIFSMIGCYILMITICNILCNFEMNEICKIILKGSTKTEKDNCKIILKRKTHKKDVKGIDLRLILCYITIVISIIIFACIYIKVITIIFKMLKLGNANILFSTIIYLFAIVLYFLSKTNKIDIEYYYIRAIEEIRFKSLNCDKNN